jgi:hypothetical protein
MQENISIGGEVSLGRGYVIRSFHTKMNARRREFHIDILDFAMALFLRLLRYSDVQLRRAVVHQHVAQLRQK